MKTIVLLIACLTITSCSHMSNTKAPTPLDISVSLFDDNLDGDLNIVLTKDSFEGEVAISFTNQENLYVYDSIDVDDLFMIVGKFYGHANSALNQLRMLDSSYAVRAEIFRTKKGSVVYFSQHQSKTEMVVCNGEITKETTQCSSIKGVKSLNDDNRMVKLIENKTIDLDQLASFYYNEFK